MRVAYVFLEAMFPFSAWKSFKMSSEDVFFIICLLFFLPVLIERNVVGGTEAARAFSHAGGQQKHQRLYNSLCSPNKQH